MERYKNIKQKHTDIYLQYIEEHDTTSSHEGEGEWDHYHTYSISVSFHHLFKKHPGGFSVETYSVPLDFLKETELYLAVFYYNDGDTFSSTEGKWHVPGIFRTEKETQQYINKVSKINFRDNVGVDFPWAGYFSGYEYTSHEIIKLKVV